MSDSNSKSESKPIPPYVAYKTFENFVDTLQARVIPSRIDRGVMATMSGGVQSHLMSALRYFDFVNSANQPTDKIKALVNSQGEERKKQLTSLIKVGYPFLFQGFDIGSVTQPHLIEQFESHTSATGATLRKCVAFFLAISKAAGLELSPHLKKRTRVPRANGQRRRSALVASTGSAPREHEENKPSNWSEMLRSKFPTFDPEWNDEVKTKWFDAFERLMKSGEEGNQ